MAGRPRFAAIVPVDSTPLGIWRGAELIRSLLFWEPGVAWCVLLEDSSSTSGLSELSLFPSSCTAIALPNRLKSRGGSWLGGLSAGILSALAWIHSHGEAEFVLRIDTDALVIGPFAQAIRKLAQRRRDAAVIGTVGRSCNPETRARQDMQSEPRLLRAQRLWPLAPVNDDEPDSAQVEVPSFGRVSIWQRRQFDRIRPDINTAVRHGYATYEYCQGGACVVTRMMLDRLATRNFLDHASDWDGLPFPDDYVLAMYARAVGLRLYDYSGLGEPFGVQAKGLAYPPHEFVARGHAIVHSVKNDTRYSETDIREYFTQQRQALKAR